MAKNVILLSVDALRADHLSCYGYHRNTTPNIDKFADSNVIFPNSFSASSNTREGVPSLITGQYPDSAIGADYQLDSPTIADYLSNNGYHTAGFHSNPYASRAFGMDSGFDKYYDDLQLGKNKWLALAQRALDKLRNRHYVRADEINDRSLNWLDEKSEEPFFLWNHYMDVHGPYEPVSEYKQEYTESTISDRKAQALYQSAVKRPKSVTEDQKELLIDLYDAEIKYTDHYISEFISALEERGILSESLVIITADHGDAFGEHDYFEHPPFLHREVTHVPIIAKFPDGMTGTVETPVSTIDIVPTILERAEIDVDLPGGSLQAIASEGSENRVAFSQARGEKGDQHIRRFCARDITEQAMGQWDDENKTITIGEATSEEISQTLREYIQNHSDELDTDNIEDEVDNAEIEQRLSALGYKE